MLKGLSARSRRLGAGAALCLAALLAVMTPKQAQAWWGPGWGWRGGVAIAVPPVVVGAPVYAPVPVYYPYVYGPPYWHWVPEHRTANAGFVPGHWEH